MWQGFLFRFILVWYYQLPKEQRKIKIKIEVKTLFIFIPWPVFHVSTTLFLGPLWLRLWL